jgi:hypothetical protein
MTIDLRHFRILDLDLAGKVAVATGANKVATLVTMLASERTANVTGVNYVIDGGLIKTT